MGLVGQDLLGAAHPLFPLKKNLEVIFADKSTNRAIGFMQGAFGDTTEEVRFTCAHHAPKAIRIHLWWDDDHNIIPHDKCREQAKLFNQISLQFPKTHFFLSHSCEFNDKASAGEVEDRIKIIKQHAPNCTPVNCPLPGAHMVAGEINEKHGPDGSAPSPYITSFDGQDAYNYNINKWHHQHNDSLIRFLWGARYNISEVYHPGEPKPPRPLRKAFPDPKYTKSLCALEVTSGPPPNPSEFPHPLTPIEKPLLWKSHAEDVPGEDNPRDNKPLLFLRQKAARVNVLCLTGQKIGTLGYYNTYPGGLFRYYSGYIGGSNLYGWEMAKKAKHLCGSEWVVLDCNKHYYGFVHPTYRWGFYPNK